jgi:hypothetical protein
MIQQFRRYSVTSGNYQVNAATIVEKAKMVISSLKVPTLQKESRTEKCDF